MIASAATTTSAASFAIVVTGSLPVGANEAAKPQLYNAKILSVSAQLKSLAGQRVDALQAITAAGQSTVTPTRNAAGCAPVPTGALVAGTSFYPVAAQDPCLAAFSNLDSR